MMLLLRCVAVFGFIAPISAYLLWPHPEIIHDDNLIDKGWAVGYLCLSFVGWKLIPDKVIKVVFKIGFWLSVSNFLDEFVFDPLNDSYGEYGFAIIVTILILYSAWHKYRTNHSTQK